MIIGWRPPWQVGSLQLMATPGQHIFRDALRGRDVDWMPITDAWKQLSDEAISDYGAVVPAEWAASQPFVQAAIEKIRNARDHIEDCAIELQRVLKC
ncbi:MAG: hypothetical protein C0494_15905 [Sphingobium sp.]|nr:hypothetical protein [Sphingobium sp.]